jgi:hypothetical protein
MVAMGNTLAVITQDGNVFGSTVTPSTTELGPIFQFSGAKIGFNPQDRFMVTMFSNYLTVITQAGDMFAAEVDFANNNISPVFQLSGAKIGSNPQDRFMVTISNTLAVITQDGDVFGAPIRGQFSGLFFQPQSLGPVFQFSGAKIGFNPQDRFMVTIPNDILAVITQTGDVFGAVVDVRGRNIGPVFQFGGAKIGFNPQDRFMVASELLDVVL